MSDCRILPACAEVLKEATASGTCPEFSVCLPFGGRLYSNGGCVNYEPGTPPEDGIYSKVVIANGCIVGLEKGDIPIYTTPPCAPVPAPCDCDGGSESLPDPSTTAGNLFRYDAAGRPLVLLSTRAGDGISITGRGTNDDPLVITANAQEGAGIQIRGTDLINIEGDGSVESPYRISHKANGTPQVIAGMSFDAAGHMIDYAPSPESATVNRVEGGSGIDASTDISTGTVTVSLARPLSPAKGDYTLGGYSMGVDDNNLIYDVRRNITIDAGIYRLGQWDVTLNDTGSITEIAPVDLNAVYTSASHRFTVPNESHSISFTTAVAASFHIVYTGTQLPADFTVYVDGTLILGDFVPSRIPINSGETSFVNQRFRYEVLTPAIYAIGPHSIMVASVSTPISAGYLTVNLTTVV